MRTPDFENIELILDKKAPKRPTLFEFFINNTISEKLSGMCAQSDWDCAWNLEMVIAGMSRAAYDYVTLHGAAFGFSAPREKKESISINECVIADGKDLAAFPFVDPNACDYSRLARAEKLLPKGMKLIAFGPGGVLENVIALVGYENLCIALYDDPDFVEKVFAEVGGRLLAYYENCLKYDSVGAIISNDDWGFNTSTMLSDEDMRKFVFPWHKRIVEAAHRSGRKAILHSCGKLDLVFSDIVEELKYDGKHSYEDVICPVEEMYEKWKGKIAVLGGIDLDFVCRKTPEEIFTRCKAMVERGQIGYALGTGNSIADYVPPENYAAMVRAVYPEFSYLK